MDTLFSHVNVVTMNEQMTLWQDAFVGVTDGKIAYMAKKPPEEKPKKIIDATGIDFQKNVKERMKNLSPFSGVLCPQG